MTVVLTDFFATAFLAVAMRASFFFDDETSLESS
jgi:hypothetical protein